jgi:hypothetical protein
MLGQNGDYHPTPCVVQLERRGTMRHAKMRGRIPAQQDRLAYVAVLVTLAALAGVSRAGANSALDSKNNPVAISQASSSNRNNYRSACSDLTTRGIDVRATKKAGGGGGTGTRAVAEGTSGPAACQVEFSLRVPAVKPAVAFTGAIPRQLVTPPTTVRVQCVFHTMHMWPSVNLTERWGGRALRSRRPARGVHTSTPRRLGLSMCASEILWSPP